LVVAAIVTRLIITNLEYHTLINTQNSKIFTQTHIAEREQGRYFQSTPILIFIVYHIFLKLQILNLSSHIERKINTFKLFFEQETLSNYFLNKKHFQIIEKHGMQSPIK